MHTRVRVLHMRWCLNACTRTPVNKHQHISIHIFIQQYECCKGGDTFVVVEVQVTTKLGKVDETWTKLNEHDLNFKNAKSCLPPVVVCVCVCVRAQMHVSLHISLCVVRFLTLPIHVALSLTFPLFHPASRMPSFVLIRDVLFFLRLGPFGHVCVDPPSVRVSSEMGVALSSCV